MLKAIWIGLKDLAGRKKFQAAVISGMAWGIGKLGLDLSPSELYPIVGPLWLYIFGQGLADFGKEAKKLVDGQ